MRLITWGFNIAKSAKSKPVAPSPKRKRGVLLMQALFYV
jgi:hypothetical protein